MRATAGSCRIKAVRCNTGSAPCATCWCATQTDPRLVYADGSIGAAVHNRQGLHDNVGVARVGTPVRIGVGVGEVVQPNACGCRIEDIGNNSWTAPHTAVR